jgi:hypothetical protein
MSLLGHVIDRRHLVIEHGRGLRTYEQDMLGLFEMG